MKALSFLGYSLLVGLLMAGFILVPGVFRYVFSLGAVLIGIRYFRQHEGKGLRIGFIALAVSFSMLLPLIYVAFALAYGWRIDPRILQDVTPSS